jgi:hypothetical protein
MNQPIRFPFRRRLFASLAFFVAGAAPGADPLTKHLEIDFGRDVASRELKGLATRSDGRIVPGPVLTELAGPTIGELLWTLESAGGVSRGWLVGTGPEGRIMEIALNGATYTTREVARLAEPQVFAVKALPDGTLLAGTSPTGALYLLRNGKPFARVVLPVDSIFDIVLLPGVNRGGQSAVQNAKPGITFALVATGNPGRIYRVDLARFSAAGINPARIADPAQLAAKGITLFGEIRDRNVRRLALLPDGRIAAGSAPKGNVYLFPAPDGPTTDSSTKAVPPVILQENREAEVTDLLAEPNGDLYASIVFSNASGERRINRPGPAPAVKPAPATPVDIGAAPVTSTALPSLPEAPKLERFSGRSAVLFFPAAGFPEQLFSRSGLAFYRLARHGDLLLVAAGEQGEVLGWDLKNRLGLTFAGSVGSQLNGLAPLPGSSGGFLLLRNNAPGFALLDFAGTAPRRLETNRLDLGLPAELGNLRFAKLRNIALEAIEVDAKTSLGSDETEGWTEWTRLAIRDGAHYSAGLRGRYLKLKIAVPAGAPDFQIDTATLYHLPQNRRPILTEFRVLPPNLALNPVPEFSPPPFTTLGQMINPSQPAAGIEGAADAKRKPGFLGSQLVADPGSQVVYWTVADSDGDTLAYTFSIKRADAAEWTDLAVNIRDNYVQFSTATLPDGLYLTRLIAAEQAPRPAAQRLRVDFETDDLVIDHTPPEILDAAVRRDGASLFVTVHGRDALSLLDGAEFVFNNGYREIVQHPMDGINDGREETYELQSPAAKVTGASAVEIHLYDESGNAAVRRVTLPE